MTRSTMRTAKPWLLLILLLLAVAWWTWLSPRRHATDVAPAPGQGSAVQGMPVPQMTDAAQLPQQVRDTLRLIAAGGPFAHRQDGEVFGNYEGILPRAPRGYYHEYTVETPGAGDRGARRIITGGTPPQVYYYTDDHYHSFRQLQPR